MDIYKIISLILLIFLIISVIIIINKNCPIIDEEEDNDYETLKENYNVLKIAHNNLEKMYYYEK